MSPILATRSSDFSGSRRKPMRWPTNGFPGKVGGVVTGCIAETNYARSRKLSAIALACVTLLDRCRKYCSADQTDDSRADKRRLRRELPQQPADCRGRRDRETSNQI